MAEKVTVYHPALKATKEVPAGSVSVLEKSGWTTELPKKVEKQLEKEAK